MQSCSRAILSAGLLACAKVRILLSVGPGFIFFHNLPIHNSNRMMPKFHTSAAGPPPFNMVSGLRYLGNLKH